MFLNATYEPQFHIIINPSLMIHMSIDFGLICQHI